MDQSRVEKREGSGDDEGASRKQARSPWDVSRFLELSLREVTGRDTARLYAMSGHERREIGRASCRERV